MKISPKVRRNISRIASILETPTLDSSITGLPSFDLSALGLDHDTNFTVPNNLRLGHLIERIIAQLIRASSAYTMLHEGVQIAEGKRTLGELDFIVKAVATGQLIHVEFAYKFYLLDPAISSDPIANWIGPNRNDSLIEKLDKTKNKQFPLLYHPATRAMLSDIHIEDVSQQLCLLTSLFVPYDFEGSLHPAFARAIQGYYLDYSTFMNLEHTDKLYHIPPKTDWGIAPSGNESWTTINGIEAQLRGCIDAKRAPLVWQKGQDSFSAFFVVWW